MQKIADVASARGFLVSHPRAGKEGRRKEEMPFRCGNSPVGVMASAYALGQAGVVGRGGERKKEKKGAWPATAAVPFLLSPSTAQRRGREKKERITAWEPTLSFLC